MSNSENIQKALDIALKQFGVTNNIVVALENINAPTNTATPYLSSFLLPSPTETADLYFTDRRSGIYQVDINYASHIGSAPLNKMADLLELAFKPSTTLVRGGLCIEIINFSAERVTVENGWAVKPITINWITYTERL